MAESINSLVDLAEKLTTCNFDDKKTVEGFLTNLNLDADYIADNCSWDEKKYTRNLVHRDENFEILLLCWKPGQSSPIHDHSGSSCWMAILQGNAKEEIFTYELHGENLDNVQPLHSRKVESPGFVYINDDVGIHKVSNVGKEDMITLHIYAKPIGKCYRYSQERKETYPAEFNNDFKYPLEKIA